MKYLMLLVLLLFSISTSASNCPDLLKPFSFDAKSDALFSTEFGDELISKLKPEVHKIWEQDPALGPESMRAIFRLYLRERLAPLPADVRQKVMDVAEGGIKMKLSVANSEKPPEFAAFSHRGLYMVFMVVPGVIFETALDYFIRVHEIEHITQYYVLGTFDTAELHPFRSTNLFYIERGAMRSEATFLKLFPQEYLENLTQLWNNHPHEVSRTDNLFNNVLKHAVEAETLDEYVLLQGRESGRYTESRLRALNRNGNIKFWTATTLLTAPIWLKIFGVF